MTGPTRRTKSMVTGSEDSKFWDKNRIWVWNCTQQQVIIVIHWRAYPLQHLVKAAAKAQVGKTTGIDSAFEWAKQSKEEWIESIVPLPADHGGFQPFSVGPGADAFIVTAYTPGSSPSEPDQLFCSSLLHKRQSLTIMPPAIPVTVGNLVEGNVPGAASLCSQKSKCVLM